MYMMFVPHRKYTYRARPPVTGIGLLFYMYMMFVLHRKYAYRPRLPVTGIALLVHI
jgi:hypothetical protein